MKLQKKNERRRRIKTLNANNTRATIYMCNQNSNSYSYLGNISSTMSRKKLIALKHTIAIYFTEKHWHWHIHAYTPFTNINTQRHAVKTNTSHTGALENHLNQRDSINYYYNKYICTLLRLRVSVRAAQVFLVRLYALLLVVFFKCVYRCVYIFVYFFWRVLIFRLCISLVAHVKCTH